MRMLRARSCCQALRVLGAGPARPPCGSLPRLPTTPPATPPSVPPCSPSSSRLSIRSFTSPPGGAPPSRVIAVKSDAEYLSALNLAQENHGLAVVYFTAKWCGPCKMISPIVDELSIKYDKATFLKVDIDEEKLHEVVSDEKIASVPTFRFFRGGKSSGEVIGANAKELKDKVAALSSK